MSRQGHAVTNAAGLSLGPRTNRSADIGASPRTPAPLPERTDEQLAASAALGDRDAFALIVQRCAPGMHRYAVGMLEADFQAAEDAVQGALAKAWVALPTFRGQSSLRTWLFRITANEVLAARRRRRPVSVDDGLIGTVRAPRGHEPEQVAATRELRDALNEALSELPWRQRAAWLLREVEHLPYSQIASVLGTNETVVRGQLHRARRTLAVRMEQWR
ncbi:sigma-70 family RNA polymerase sigma factor [Phycicoccus sp. MAQZ13P-2]|nr:sigma-70 family RNA polymerase sigma factor [Phycicoccus mangrovi]MBT9273675.1 sigma-70 family RNA polymerase sigma factor [Phycicoccus mangrovi]